MDGGAALAVDGAKLVAVLASLAQRGHGQHVVCVRQTAGEDVAVSRRLRRQGWRNHGEGGTNEANTRPVCNSICIICNYSCSVCCAGKLTHTHARRPPEEAARDEIPEERTISAGVYIMLVIAGAGQEHRPRPPLAPPLAHTLSIRTHTHTIAMPEPLARPRPRSC